MRKFKNVQFSLILFSALLLLSGCCSLQGLLGESGEKPKMPKAKKAEFSDMAYCNFLPAEFTEVVTYTGPILYADQIYETENRVKTDALVGFARSFLGMPYRYAGRRPTTGFDCSGFTHYLLKNFGYEVSPASRVQATEGEAIDFEEVRKGDLLFFGRKNADGSHSVNHVGMVISAEGETPAMIHSSSRGIVIDRADSGSWRSYYASRYLFARRHIKSEQIKPLYGTNEAEDLLLEASR